MQPYYQDKFCTIYHGDCREVLLDIGAFDVIMTDPVWPNCPDGLLQGSDDPQGLFASMIEATARPRRMVVVMRCDSDPRFLTAIPAELRFFRQQTLSYAMPTYIGRVLGGDE